MVIKRSSFVSQRPKISGEEVLRKCSMYFLYPETQSDSDFMPSGFDFPFNFSIPLTFGFPFGHVFMS